MASLDRIFDLLSEEQRRYALYYLDRHGGPVSVDELAVHVAEWQSDPGSVSIPDDTFDRIEIDLLHVDLPKAADAPFVQYNQEERTVELTGPAPKFNAVISVAKVIERPNREP
ncbi:hypothetical protein HUG10_20180 (plasmid) [Halorarum halophilum]|uniref:DUF7344 domain-containing protein n=1 Tax=Halorarum halophilum TaxID=2743090 RepID=A0A7D5GEL5_9EURY|nr:hypothetical protein [Halobaculum halophilum]QLG29926.1 hypothetical protein HUG10_20180 [Halobaculum halophilum]